MEANRKRNRVAFATVVNPYGYDPLLPVLSGDWRLNPGQLGKVWHPSQPVRNSWSDWASAERQIFDFSKRQYAPVDPHLTGEAAVAKLSYMNLDVAQVDPGEIDFAEGVGGLSSSALATGDSDIGFDQSEQGVQDVIAQRSKTFAPRYFSAPPPVQSQFVNLDPAQLHASLVPSGTPPSSARLPERGQERLAFYAALGVAHAFTASSDLKRYPSSSSLRQKRDGTSKVAPTSASSYLALSIILTSAQHGTSGHSSKESSRSNSRPGTPGGDSMLVDGGAVESVASLGASTAQSNGTSGSGLGRGEAGLVAAAEGSADRRARSGTGATSEGASEGAIAAVEEGGGMLFVAEPDPEEAADDDMTPPLLPSARQQEQEDGSEDDNGDSSEEDERPARRSRRDTGSDVASSSVRSRGSSVGSGTSRGSRSSRSSGGGGGGQGPGAQLDDLNRPSMLLHTNAYGRPSCCDQGFAAEFVAMKAQQQQQQQQQLHDQQRVVQGAAGTPTVAFTAVDEAMTAPRPPSRGSELRASASRLHANLTLPPGVLGPSTIPFPAPHVRPTAQHAESVLSWLPARALAATAAASSAFTPAGSSRPHPVSAVAAETEATTGGAVAAEAAAMTGGAAAVALTKALTAPAGSRSAGAATVGPSFAPTGAEAAQQLAGRVEASRPAVPVSPATTHLVPYARPKQVGVSTGETDDEEESEKLAGRSSAVEALRGLGAANKRQASDPAVVALLQAVKLGGKAVLQKMTDEQRRLVKMERTKLNKRASRARERAHDRSLAIMTRLYELTALVLSVATPGKLRVVAPAGEANDMVDGILSLPRGLFPGLPDILSSIQNGTMPSPEASLGLPAPYKHDETLGSALGVRQSAALRAWLLRMVLGLSIPSVCVPGADTVASGATPNKPPLAVDEQVLAMVLQVAQARKDGAQVQLKLAPADSALGRSSSARRSGRGSGPIPPPLPSRPTRASARTRQSATQAVDMDEEGTEASTAAGSRGSGAPAPSSVPGLPSTPSSFLEVSDLPALPSLVNSTSTAAGPALSSSAAAEALAANPLAAVHVLTVQQGHYRDRCPLLAYRMSLDRLLVMPNTSLPANARMAAEQLGLGLRTAATEVECLAVLQQVVRSDAAGAPPSPAAASLSNALCLTPAQKALLEGAFTKGELRAQAGVLKRGHAAGEYVSKTLFSVAQEAGKSGSGDSAPPGVDKGRHGQDVEEGASGGAAGAEGEGEGAPGEEGEDGSHTTGSSASNAAIQSNAVLSELAAGTGRDAVSRFVEWLCSQPLTRATGPGSLHPSTLPSATTLRDLNLRPEEIPALASGVVERHCGVDVVTDLGGYAFVQSHRVPQGGEAPVLAGIDIGQETDVILFRRLAAALETGQRQKPAGPPGLPGLMSSMVPVPGAHTPAQGIAQPRPHAHAAPSASAPSTAAEAVKRASQPSLAQSLPWGASVPQDGAVRWAAASGAQTATLGQAVPGQSSMAAF